MLVFLKLQNTVIALHTMYRHEIFENFIKENNAPLVSMIVLSPESKLILTIAFVDAKFPDSVVSVALALSTGFGSSIVRA